MKTLPLPVLGIDMLSEDTDLQAGTARSVVNVDLGRSVISRRPGYGLVGTRGQHTGIHAVGDRVLLGLDGDLVDLDTANYATRVMCSMGTPHAIDFHDYNDSTYAISPSAFWRIPRGADPVPVGVQVPALPDPVPHGVGNLSPGMYGVAVSLVDESGEESAAVQLGPLRLATGLRLENAPILPGMRWRVYLTPPDGDVLYLAEEFAAVMDRHVVTVYPGGAPCQTLHLSPMPAGDFVRSQAARLYVARDDVLVWSEAFRPHLTALRSNFVQFAGRIRFLELLAGGAFVGDSEGVWWMAGTDPTTWTKRRVSKSLAVRRSSIELKGEDMGMTGHVVVWLAADGYYVGSGDGSVKQLQPGRIRVDPSTEGRSVFITRDGLKQVITLTASPAATVFGVALDSATLQ